VTVAGNLKFDVRAADESEAVRLLREASAGLRLVVAGSTLEGEETALLEAWPEILTTEPRLAMVLAPRHPERFAVVAALLDQAGVVWRRRSEWKGAGQPLAAGEIVLLDTIGELAGVYSLAAVAFVGGSIVPAGGHNPLEPAQFGVPIIMGQHYTNFRAITYDLLAHEALRILGRESVANTVVELLQDHTAAAAMGARARQVFDEQAGATARCVAALSELLTGRAAAKRAKERAI